MAKTIIEMAQKKRVLIRRNSSAAGQNVQLAVAAIIGGIRSHAWRSYMMQFIEQNIPGQPVEPAQLERLLGTDGTLGHVTLDRRRAYLVANAVCGSETELTTTFTVDTIDDTLPNVGHLEAAAQKYPFGKASSGTVKGKKKTSKKSTKNSGK